MRSRKRFVKQQEVDVADLYALKPGSLWKALKRENISLWMLCSYFFIEYVRLQDNLFPALEVIPMAQIFMIATIASLFVDPTIRWTKNTENTWFILFTLIVIMSGIFAFNPSLSVAYWNEFGGWFIVYFLVILVVNTEKRLILFVLAYCLFNLKMSQHGAIGWAERGFSFAKWGLTGSGGPFRNSGEYAIQMLIYGSLAISIVIGLRVYWGRYKKWILYAAAATGYLAVMGASSRGAQVALAAIGLWLLLKQKNGLKGLLAVSILAYILFNILPEEQIQRFVEIGADDNSLQRLAYWEYGLSNVIPDNPVLGVGYHNWLAYLHYSVPQGLGPYQMVQESHNIYIQAASELGIPGLFIFLMLILFAFINNARSRKMADEMNKRFLFFLAYGLDAGLIGFLVAGSFVTVLYYPFFWIQISMIVALNNVSRNCYQQFKQAI